MKKPCTVWLSAEASRWLCTRGTPDAALRALVAEAMRRDTLMAARGDELAVERLVRQAVRRARRQGADEPACKAMAAQLLDECAASTDPVQRAAAARVGLLFELRGGSVRTHDHVRELKRALMRLRIQRPGGWRKVGVTPPERR